MARVGMGRCAGLLASTHHTRLVAAGVTLRRPFGGGLLKGDDAMIGTWLYTRTMRAAFGHFGRHDIESFSRPWAEDVVFVYPPGTSMGGRFEGKEAMKAWIQSYMDRFPRIEFTVKGVFVEDPLGLKSNVVTTEWDVAITNRRGEDFVYGGVTVIRVEKTKVVLAKDYLFDTSVVRRALGGGDERQSRA